MTRPALFLVTVSMLAVMACMQPLPFVGTQTVPDIEILQSRPVDRAYEELGIITVEAQDPQARRRLAARARGMGADAAVVIGTSRRNIDVAVPDISSGVSTRATVPLITVTAIAIRYLDGGAPPADEPTPE